MNLKKLKKLQNELAKYRYKCKQGCYECCTWIQFLEEEKKLMDKELRKQGYKEPPNWKGSNYCEYLTTEGKCSIYSARPIVCRSFSDKKIQFNTEQWPVLTTSCTYWTSNKVLIADKDYLDYWKEVLDKWIYNKNTLNLMREFINKNPLIDIPEHLK